MSYGPGRGQRNHVKECPSISPRSGYRVFREVGLLKLWPWADGCIPANNSIPSSRWKGQEESKTVAGAGGAGCGK